MDSIIMWAHGNALIVETPENMVNIRRRGWGTDLYAKRGTGTWLHIPVPTPSQLANLGVYITKVILLFECKPGDGEITNIHVFDGARNIHESNNLHLDGSHLFGWNRENTIEFPQYEKGRSFGIGITFHFQAAICIDEPCSDFFMLRIAGAGVEFSSGD